MSLLDEIISESKFERNIKIFKKILYTSIGIAAVMIVAAIIYGNNQAKEKAYNREISKDLLEMKVDIKKLNNDASINSIARFQKINQELELYYNLASGKKNQEELRIEKDNFVKNIIAPLESLCHSEDFLINYHAHGLIAMLIIDFPEFFEESYAKSYFAKLTIEKLFNFNGKSDVHENLVFLKCIWLKSNNLVEFGIFSRDVIDAISASEKRDPSLLELKTLVNKARLLL